jgi:hypothetical protein
MVRTIPATTTLLFRTWVSMLREGFGVHGSEEEEEEAYKYPNPKMTTSPTFCFFVVRILSNNMAGSVTL